MKGARRACNSLRSPRLANVGFNAPEAAKYPQHVAVDYGQRVSERDAADGGRRVRPETGQPAQDLGVLGQFAAVPGYQHPRGLVQMAGPGIVAEPFPELEHRLLVRRGQRRYVGEGAHEALEIGDDGVDLGLLQHHLAEPHVIGPAVVPPRQAPTVLPVPVQQSCHPVRHGAALLGSDTVLRGQDETECTTVKWGQGTLPSRIPAPNPLPQW